MVVSLKTARKRENMTLRLRRSRSEPRNFQRVNARLFRGGQPRGQDMAKLKEMGVRTIIDLRRRARVKGTEERHARALGIRYHRIPLGHLRGPVEESIERIL